MIDIQQILNTIDISEMDRKFVDFNDMSETEFQIYDYIQQPEPNRLTYCYYHRWVCTDSEVGIRVWYFDDKPVCVSWKPYRKSDETYNWLSEKDFYIVLEFVRSLINIDFDINILDDETINDVVDVYKTIDYKKFEKLNIKK